MLRHAAVGALCLAVLLTSGCGRSFRPQGYNVGLPLYEASLARFERGKWGDAIAGFERLTLELPPRDPLLPLSHYYLGLARQKKREHLLAAQTFSRLTASFPADTLADDALYQAGVSYAALWRKPELDPEYGDAALDAFRTLLSEYPESPLADEARREMAELLEMRARKDYETGRWYLRRRFRDSAILYFRGVVERYPETETARLAYLRMLEAYRAINYAEEAAEVCATLWERYPADGEVRRACGPAPSAATVGDSSAA